MNVTVVGCGRWGTFIGWYLDKIGHEVKLYGKAGAFHFEQLCEYRQNSYLKLRDSTALTCDICDALQLADVVVISVGAQNFRECMLELCEYGIREKIIVLCMKGIEMGSCKTLTQVASEYVDDLRKVAIWAGPGHVQDFVNGIPNCMVIDSLSNELKLKLVDEFGSDLIRFYIGQDLIGNEIGAAAKNVIGIAAGLLDGLGFSSLKGALMSRAAREIARLIEKIGGNGQSAFGLCHLGDYQATLFSEHSHNRMFGEMFAKGHKYKDLAEGVFTAEAIMGLSEKYDVELPICKAVYDVIHLGCDPQKTLHSLFVRSVKPEF